MSTRQRNMAIVKILFILFIITSGIAVYLYLSAKSSSAENFDLNSAENKAKKENKLVLLNIYTRWDNKSKELINEISSDKLIKEQISNNFVLTNLSIDDENNKNIAKERFEITNIPTLVILNSKDKEIDRISGNFSKEEINSWLRDTSRNYINYWGTFEEAKNESERYGKPVLVVVSFDYKFQSQLHKLMATDEVSMFISQSYVPVYLVRSTINDRKTIDSINTVEMNQNFSFASVFIISPKKPIIKINITFQFLANPQSFIDKLSSIKN